MGFVVFRDGLDEKVTQLRVEPVYDALNGVVVTLEEIAGFHMRGERFEHLLGKSAQRIVHLVVGVSTGEVIIFDERFVDLHFEFALQFIGEHVLDNGGNEAVDKRVYRSRRYEKSYRRVIRYAVVLGGRGYREHYRRARHDAFGHVAFGVLRKRESVIGRIESYGIVLLGLTGGDFRKSVHIFAEFGEIGHSDSVVDDKTFSEKSGEIGEQVDIVRVLSLVVNAHYAYAENVAFMRFVVCGA